jgi:para-nitrobenzyl esterase
MIRSLAAAVALSSLLAASAFAAPAATVENGAVAGASTDGVDVYKGIPYAAPPVGPLRWKPPAPPASWTGTREATQFGAICPQPQRSDAALLSGSALAQSEDCLTLNVWAPPGAHHAPVMVWIHGGAHRFGSGAAPFYDGTLFAKDGIVLVTINYRLGLLGYFAHPALTKEAGAGAPLGNYGQMDQIAALAWVKRNIAAFGGDPSNVTVFGESAGGSSILSLLATPSARGLFARAIVESGGGWGADTTLANKETEGVDFASRAGLPGADATAEQLRALPVEKTFDIPARLGFGPFADGRLVPEAPAHAFAQGHEIPVPLMIGSNSYEASLMQSFQIPPDWILQQLTPEVRAVYQGDASSDQALAAAVFTDSIMGAPARWVAARAAHHAPAYLYHFSYVASARRQGSSGATHGSEIPYVFGTGLALAQRFGIPLTDEDVAMVALMRSCWEGFARSGKPSCGGWPAYTAAGDTLMEFGAHPGPVTGFRKAQYDALEARLKPN